MAAKIEFLQLSEDARLKTDLTREDIEKFWVDFKNEYPILSIKGFKFHSISFSLLLWSGVFFNGVYKD